MKTLLMSLLLGAGAWLSVPEPAPAVRRSIVLIVADDLSPTLGCYGDSVAPTPVIDRLAREGVLFENAFCVAPSCSPSRASMLTGQYPHQLEEGANLWGKLPRKYPNVVEKLEAAGYRIGLTGKGWGPGNYRAGGYEHNPAGPGFDSFGAFLDAQPDDRPFCFWLGPHDPHRPYAAALKGQMNLRPAALRVPPYLPDTPEVREDLLDYYAETARVEQAVAEVVARLEAAGRLDETLLVVTGDNGLPFPRAKANLYDAGTRVPLVIRGGPFRGGRRMKAPVSLIDLVPTLLDWADQPALPEAAGRPLQRWTRPTRPPAAPIFVERERHARVRAGNGGYPGRGIRTERYLFIENPHPDRWPAGDAPAFGDIDDGPSKRVLLNPGTDATRQRLRALAVERRPAVELYDLRTDPHQFRNVAEEPAYRRIRQELTTQLRAWQRRTADPRLGPEGDRFDAFTYYTAQTAQDPD